MNSDMVQLETSIPEDVYLTLKNYGLAREDLSQQARQLLAVHFFQDNLLSLGKAARLAGMDRWRFIDLLGEQQVPVVDLDEEEFANEMAAVEVQVQTLRRRQSS